MWSLKFLMQETHESLHHYRTAICPKGHSLYTVLHAAISTHCIHRPKLEHIQQGCSA